MHPLKGKTKTHMVVPIADHLAQVAANHQQHQYVSFANLQHDLDTDASDDLDLDLDLDLDDSLFDTQLRKLIVQNARATPSAVVVAATPDGGTAQEAPLPPRPLVLGGVVGTPTPSQFKNNLHCTITTNGNCSSSSTDTEGVAERRKSAAIAFPQHPSSDESTDGNDTVSNIYERPVDAAAPAPPPRPSQVLDARFSFAARKQHASSHSSPPPATPRPSQSPKERFSFVHRAKQGAQGSPPPGVAIAEGSSAIQNNGPVMHTNSGGKYAGMFAAKLKTQQDEQKLMLLRKQMGNGKGSNGGGGESALVAGKEHAAAVTAAVADVAVVRTHSASAGTIIAESSVLPPTERAALLVQRPTWPLIKPSTTAAALAAAAGVEAEGGYDNILGEDGLAADVAEFSGSTGEVQKKHTPSLVKTKVQCLKKKGWFAQLRAAGTATSVLGRHLEVGLRTASDPTPLHERKPSTRVGDLKEDTSHQGFPSIHPLTIIVTYCDVTTLIGSSTSIDAPSSVEVVETDDSLG
jgi:hypothetical protein